MSECQGESRVVRRRTPQSDQPQAEQAENEVVLEQIAVRVEIEVVVEDDVTVDTAKERKILPSGFGF